MTYQRVLVGVDGSPTSMKALDVAVEMAAADKAELVILCAYSRAGSSERILESASAAARRDGLAMRAIAEQGPAVDTILSVAAREGVDLIVLGNKGMHGTQRFLLGSVPDEVSHRAPCDILIARTT